MKSQIKKKPFQFVELLILTLNQVDKSWRDKSWAILTK